MNDIQSDPNMWWEAFTSHGATCPETLRTSDILQVNEDQWMTEKCDIRYTSCFDVAQTKFLNCINRQHISISAKKKKEKKNILIVRVTKISNRLHMVSIVVMI